MTDTTRTQPDLSLKSDRSPAKARKATHTCWHRRQGHTAALAALGVARAYRRSRAASLAALEVPFPPVGSATMGSVSEVPDHEPTDAEWRRFAFGSGVMFLGTLAFSALFFWVLPFSPIVRAVILTPPVLFSGWIWVWVGLGRDTQRLRRLNALAERRGGGRRR